MQTNSDVIVFVGPGSLFGRSTGSNPSRQRAAANEAECMSGSLLNRTINNTPLSEYKIRGMETADKLSREFERFGYVLNQDWGDDWYPSAETRYDPLTETIYVKLDFVSGQTMNALNIWAKMSDLWYRSEKLPVYRCLRGVQE